MISESNFTYAHGLMNYSQPCCRIIMVDDISIVTGKTKKFGTVDYAIFSAILIVSAAIGFYFAWVDRRKTTIKDYMLAGGNMQVRTLMSVTYGS